MVVASFALWFVLVYGAFVAFRGNPLHDHVVRADALLLARAEAISLGEVEEEPTEEEARFLRRFSRLMLLEFGLVLLEFGVLGWLWWRGTMPWVSFGLIWKNLFVFVLSVTAAGSFSPAETGVFGALVSLPRWVVVVDRVSAVLSAVGALSLFLHLNRIWPW